jgi:hypothetical protein
MIAFFASVFVLVLFHSIILLMKVCFSLFVVTKEIRKIDDMYKYEILTGNPQETSYKTSFSDQRNKFLELNSQFYF